jgi:hypothetical protein
VATEAGVRPKDDTDVQPGLKGQLRREICEWITREEWDTEVGDDANQLVQVCRDVLR